MALKRIAGRKWQKKKREERKTTKNHC